MAGRRAAPPPPPPARTLRGTPAARPRRRPSLRASAAELPAPGGAGEGREGDWRWDGVLRHGQCRRHADAVLDRHHHRPARGERPLQGGLAPAPACIDQASRQGPCAPNNECSTHPHPPARALRSCCRPAAATPQTVHDGRIYTLKIYCDENYPNRVGEDGGNSQGFPDGQCSGQAAGGPLGCSLQAWHTMLLSSGSDPFTAATATIALPSPQPPQVRFVSRINMGCVASNGVVGGAVACLQRRGPAAEACAGRCNNSWRSGGVRHS